MCFSSTLLITMSHTLLPGPPQRKLNASSSVWLPPPPSTLCELPLLPRYYWAVVFFKTPARQKDPAKRHIFSPLFFCFFSPKSQRLKLACDSRVTMSLWVVETINKAAHCSVGMTCISLCFISLKHFTREMMHELRALQIIKLYNKIESPTN